MVFRTIFSEHKRNAKNFNLKETIKMAGKEIVLYNYIQENREDTEIIPTLEKYGCIDKMQTNYNQVYIDTKMIPKNIFDAKKKRDAVIEIFENMAYKDRAEFNHNVDEFIEKGENWLLSKLNKEITINENKQSDTAKEGGKE